MRGALLPRQTMEAVDQKRAVLETGRKAFKCVTKIKAIKCNLQKYEI